MMEMESGWRKLDSRGWVLYERVGGSERGVVIPASYQHSTL